jgi:hypothetical protein
MSPISEWMTIYPSLGCQGAFVVTYNYNDSDREAGYSKIVSRWPHLGDAIAAIDAYVQEHGAKAEPVPAFDSDKVQVVSAGEWTSDDSDEKKARPVVGKDSLGTFHAGLEVAEPGEDSVIAWDASGFFLNERAAIVQGDEMLSEWIRGNEDECGSRPRM